MGGQLSRRMMNNPQYEQGYKDAIDAVAMRFILRRAKYSMPKNEHEQQLFILFNEIITQITACKDIQQEKSKND